MKKMKDNKKHTLYSVMLEEWICRHRFIIVKDENGNENVNGNGDRDDNVNVNEDGDEDKDENGNGNGNENENGDEDKDENGNGNGNEDIDGDLDEDEEDVEENIIFAASLVAGRPERLSELKGLLAAVLPKLEGKNELFWLEVAIRDAEVAKYRFETIELLRQLQLWFPDHEWFASELELQRAAGSITIERRKWKINGERLPLRKIAQSVKAHVIPREWMTTGHLSLSKLNRITAVAFAGLYQPLVTWKNNCQ